MNEHVESSPKPAVGRAVWFFSGDLMFASRVRGAAERAGLTFQLLGKWPAEPTAPPAWIIVDLATRGGAAAELRRLAAESCPHVPTIAYGPHVQADRLRSAREAGFTQVLTRGQFDAMLVDIFSSHD